MAILAGLIVLSLAVDGVEQAVVRAVHGSLTQDEAVDFGIRNRLAMLVTKLVQNTGVVVLAGYAAAKIAGQSPLLHGAALAINQLA